jgi:hypothetical protein
VLLVVQVTVSTAWRKVPRAAGGISRVKVSEPLPLATAVFSRRGCSRSRTSPGHGAPGTVNELEDVDDADLEPHFGIFDRGSHGEDISTQGERDAE